MGTDYTVGRGGISSAEVAYSCGACKTALKTPLNQAGAEDTCPMCGSVHIVPGRTELEAVKASEQQAVEELAKKATLKARSEMARQKKMEHSRRVAEAQPCQDSEQEAGRFGRITREDHALHTLFRMAEFTSVLVIGLCLLIIFGGIITLLVVAGEHNGFSTFVAGVPLYLLMGLCFILLPAFLILLVLIKIERNTRMLGYRDAGHKQPD